MTNYDRLCRAAMQGNVREMKVALEAGVDQKQRDHALFLAIWARPRPDVNDPVESVKILISAGADVNARDPEGGETPLMCAAMCGNVGAMRLLLAAHVDVNATSRAGWTAFALATQYHRTDASDNMVRLLRVHKALLRDRPHDWEEVIL